MSRNPKSLIGLNQVDTVAFRFWFCGSKVVDQLSDPLVVYHGSKTKFDSFDIGRGTTNYCAFGEYKTSRSAAFFAADKDFAKEFGGGVEVLSLYLSIKNPLNLTEGYPNDFYLKHMQMLSANNLVCMRPEEMWELFDSGFPGADEFMAAVKADGYDGLKTVERDAGGGMRDVWLALNPTQIKSVTGNCGHFDPINPNIYMSRVARARSR